MRSAAAETQRKLLQSTPEEAETRAAGSAEITPAGSAAGPASHALPAAAEAGPDAPEAASPAPSGGFGGFMRKLTGSGRGSSRGSQDMERAAREAAEAVAPPPPPPPIMVTPRTLSERALSERSLPQGASASPRPSPRPDIAPEAVVLVTPPGGGPPIPMVPLAAMETDPGEALGGGEGPVGRGRGKTETLGNARAARGQGAGPRHQRACSAPTGQACEHALQAQALVARPGSLAGNCCLQFFRTPAPCPAAMAYQMGMQAGVAAALRAGSVNASPAKAPTSGRRSVSAPQGSRSQTPHPMPAPPLPLLPVPGPCSGRQRLARGEARQWRPCCRAAPALPKGKQLANMHGSPPACCLLQNTPSRAGSISGDRPPRPRRQGSFRCAHGCPTGLGTTAPNQST